MQYGVAAYDVIRMAKKAWQLFAFCKTVSLVSKNPRQERLISRSYQCLEDRILTC